MIGYSVVNTKGQVTLPAHIRKSLGVAPGNTVMVSRTADAIIVQPVPDIFLLKGSVDPRSRPEQFKKMRQQFKKYLGSRKTE